MIFRLFAPLFAFGMLLSGCFEPRCGPYQELSTGKPEDEIKLRSGVCACVEGRKFDADLNCVKETPSMPPPTLDADAAASADGATPPMAGGCDQTTGLGCMCAGDADCAGYEASYCVIPDPADPEMKRACLYQGCDKPGKECPAELHCCKFPFAPEKTVCLPEDFECPFG